jgi:hypothetical protein
MTLGAQEEVSDLVGQSASQHTRQDSVDRSRRPRVVAAAGRYGGNERGGGFRIQLDQRLRRVTAEHDRAERSGLLPPVHRRKRDNKVDGAIVRTIVRV